MSFLSPFKKNLPAQPGASDVFSLLQTDVNRLFNRFLKDDMWEDSLPALSSKMWNPRVSMKETANEYILAVDLPGLEKNDVHISLDDNILTIKGERKSEEKKEDETHLWNEKSYGYFERSFSLPTTLIDKDSINAEMKNGELTVCLTKLPEAKKQLREIEIH